jgi:hypothetical protein
MTIIEHDDHYELPKDGDRLVSTLARDLAVWRGADRSAAPYSQD